MPSTSSVFRNLALLIPLALVMTFTMAAADRGKDSTSPDPKDSTSEKKKAPDFRATAKKPETRIRFQSEGDKTVIDIQSKFGIDTATITRTAKTWPKKLLVRLHLRGLESFRARVKGTSVQWSISSSGGNRARVSLKDKEGKETAVDASSPYFTEPKAVGGDGKIPLKGGHFEVMLPAKLLADNPDSISLSWIDFYRN